MVVSKTQVRQAGFFRLAGDLYALEVSHLQEVLEVGRLTPIPLAPPALLGMVNLRGRILPLFDLKGVLGLSRQPGAGGESAVVMRYGKQVLGLVVDEFMGLSPLQSLRPGGSGMYLGTVSFQGRSARVLNPEALMADIRGLLSSATDWSRSFE
ncbi:Chemotaxis protein CheW [Calidithermus roseus]|uniref:Chemotaxis protein CheW n=1 Tax=Calidithermus roseus TaxID=1644118 RepID=A0A399EQK8_9DEIN|nr:Chemotaxis protein CheW [Calidithermus roseus]